MKTIKDFKVKNKRVLVRTDFNVPLNKQGDILDDFRIRTVLPTINYLLEKEAKVILMSHLGRPEGKVVKKLKMDMVQNRLLEYLDVSIVKAPDCIGKKIEDWTLQMQPQEILLLENLRFHKEEKENNAQFAKDLSRLGDIYINDAFSVCHRSHASITGVAQHLPSGAGLLLEKEIKQISRVIKNPEHPLVVIIGGAKIETKIKLLNQLIKICDYLLLGGVLANTVLKAHNVSIGDSIIGEKLELDGGLLNSDKIILPTDFVVTQNQETAVIKEAGSIEEKDTIFDIGPKTRKDFQNYINQAKTIFWNGPMGLIEDKRFIEGSEDIARAIAVSKGFSVVGGGETVELLNKLGLEDKFNHVSTGGGALLAFLSDEKLPGIEIL